MDNDASAAERCRRVNPVRRTKHVIVNAIDPDPEPIAAAAATDLSVPRGKLERIVSASVDRSRSAIPGFRSGDDQPLVRSAVEVDVPCLELELRLAFRDTRALLVLRNEAEVGLADRGGVGGIGARRRVDPSATR